MLARFGRNAPSNMLYLPMLCAGTAAGGHAIRGRPAVRRAGNLVTTAGAAQLRGLTVAFRRPPLMDPYCARGAGGLSTLLLLLPGLVARRRGDARRARWFGIQTAIAFISDYVMIGARPKDEALRTAKPRNPCHVDRFEGGRKRVSDTFTHKNSGSCT